MRVIALLLTLAKHIAGAEASRATVKVGDSSLSLDTAVESDGASSLRGESGAFGNRKKRKRANECCGNHLENPNESVT